MSFVKGAVVGALVGGAGLVTLSLIAPQPAGLAPPATPLQDAPSSAAPGGGSADTASASAPGAFDEAPSSSETQLPAPVSPDATPDPVTTSADRPALATESGTLDAPVAGPAGTVEIDGDAPVLPNPQSRAPDASAPDAAASVDRTPPVPLVVDTPVDPSSTPITVVIEESDGPVAPADPSDASVGGDATQADPAAETVEAPRATEDTATDDAASAEGAADEALQMTASEASEPATVAEEADSPPASPDDQVPSEAGGAAQSQDAPIGNVGGERSEAEDQGGDGVEGGTAANESSAVASDGTDSPQPSTGADASAQGGSSGPSGSSETDGVQAADGSESAAEPSDPSGDDTPDGAAAEDGVTIAVAPSRTVRPPSSRPETEDDAPTGNGGVIVTRAGETAQPSVAPEAEPDGSDPSSEAQATDAVFDALATYSAFSDPGDRRPQMSLVLIDDGSLPDPARLLTELDLPVTVAIDPDLTDAGARMETYRALGFEVAALARLPRGGTASDAAVALEGTFSVLPEAVALVIPDSGLLSPSGDMTAEVAATLSREGRGLVIAQTGFGGTIAAIGAQDVPALPVYRDLRSIDQSERTIRRFLDQAAFRARQESGVVVLGRVRPDTLSALTLWSTANRGGQVALAPLSAVLLED